jgi:ER membrane protein complex subunit 1, C-terminal
MFYASVNTTHINSLTFNFHAHSFHSKSLSGYDNQIPHIRADTFVFPYGVRTLGITDTRNGVSTREVLCMDF